MLVHPSNSECKGMNTMVGTRRINGSLVGVLAATALFAAACGSGTTGTAAPTTNPGDSTADSGVESTGDATVNTDRLYEAAQEEGALTIYSGDSAEQMEILRAAFQEAYPGIEIAHVEGGGTSTRERIIAESASGNVLGDVVMGGGTSISELTEGGYAEPFQPSRVDELLPGLRDPEGVNTPRNVYVYGITYNTDLVSAEEAPKRWEDITDPRYKGLLSMQDPRGSGGSAVIMQGLYQAYGDEFVEALAEQEVFWSSDTEQLVSGLVRGEFPIVLSARATHHYEDRQEGAPVGFIHPEDGVFIVPIAMLLVKDAPHPNAGKLFIEWTLSEDGQQAVADAGETPAVIDAPPPADEAGDIRGTTIFEMEYDPTDAAMRQELDAKWDALFF